MSHSDDATSSRALKPDEAKSLFRDIVASGDVGFTEHAQEELANDDMETSDALNVLRGGIATKVELRHGECRYCVSTSRMCVVVTVVSKTRLRVITAWRLKP